MKPSSFRRASVAIVLAVVALASVFVILRKPLSDNLFDLLPVKDRIIARQYRFLSAIDAGGTVVAEISSIRDSLPFDSLAAAANDAVNLIGTSDLFTASALTSPAQFLALKDMLVRTWGASFTQQDSLWLAQRVVNDSLEQRFNQTLEGLFVFSDRSAGTSGLKHDPFGFSPRLLMRLAALRPSPDIDFDQGYITNTARNRILLILSAKSAELSSGASAALVAVMDNARGRVANHGAKLCWMGAQRAADDNRKTIQRDVNRTAPLTVILIVGICFLVYRRFQFGLLVFIPTILGILVAVALISLILPVSVITLGFGAALIGITVDYAVHYFFHIENVPADTAPARTLAPAIAASAATTASAFAVLAAAGIPALTQLGLITASGILLVAFFSLWALPILFPPLAGNPKPARVNLVGLFDCLYRTKHLRAVAIAVGMVSFILWLATTGLRFDGDPDNLNGMSSQTRKAEQTLARNWPGISGGTFLTVEGNTADEALEAMENSVVPLVAGLEKSRYIYPVSPVCSLIPSRRTQRENRARWQSFWTSDRLNCVNNTVGRVALRYGLNPDHFKPYVQSLNRMVNHNLSIDSLPQGIRTGPLRTHLTVRDGIWFAAVPVIAVQRNHWQKIKAHADRHNVLAVNNETLGLRLVDLVRNGFVRSLVFVPLAVIFVLALVMRNPRRIVLALIPTICSTGMTLGFMVLVGQPVNLVSGMVLAFVFGVGIDYAVFLVHTLHTDGPTPSSAARGAASVTIAALTTIAGLGIMAGAHHPVLSSLGVTGLAGVLSSYICALVLVPAMALRRGR